MASAKASLPLTTLVSTCSCAREVSQWVYTFRVGVYSYLVRRGADIDVLLFERHDDIQSQSQSRVASKEQNEDMLSTTDWP